MNRVGIVCTALILALTVVGGLAWAGIEGSKHDFTSEAWTEGDPCAACHGVHSDEVPATPPLWDPDVDLSRRFTGPVKDRALPGFGTRVCLRCHDGTLASENITAATADDRAVNKDSPALFSAGLKSSEHPVGVDYPGFDRSYRPLISVVATSAVTLPDGKVECSSCHDAHNELELAAMLVISNARSALCLTCHKK